MSCAQNRIKVKGRSRLGIEHLDDYLRVYSVPRSLFYDKLAAELREGASERLIEHKRRAVVRYLVEEYDPFDVYCLWIEKRTSGANKRSADDAQLPAAEPRSAPSLSRSSTEVE